LAQLFGKATNAEYYATKANQEETLCWINYGKEFVIQYNDLIKNSNGKIGEKKAKGIIYDKILEHITIIREKRSKEMGLQLPEISRKTLCRKTQRAVKTYNLFEKIGKDKIKYLKAYSANSISELTNDQIQKIIDNISDRDEFNIKEESNHMTEISTTARRQNHTTEIVSTFPETEVSAFSEKVSLEKLSETISEESTEASASSNPTHDHAYFRNKTLLQYSDLYKTIITEKLDYYGIIEGSLCPMCKQSHEDGKSVKGRYEAGSYFIKCGKNEIEIA
jgi:polyhydroxyalkanoate synthesis regulator phasin